MCHPDKHPGDAEAEEKFKRVGEAYHVLSTAELKERYDRFGMDAVKEGGSGAEIDPKAMFSAMFGGGRFEVRERRGRSHGGGAGSMEGVARDR